MMTPTTGVRRRWRVAALAALAGTLLVPAASAAEAQEGATTVEVNFGESVTVQVGDRLQFNIAAVGPAGPGQGVPMIFTVPAGLDYVSGSCRAGLCELLPEFEPIEPVVFDVVGPSPNAVMSLINAISGDFRGASVTIEGTAQTTANFTQQQCDVIDALVALPGLDDRGDVIRAVTQLLATTIPPPTFPPSTHPTDPPAPNLGSCIIDVVWAADDYPALDAFADDVEWTRDDVTRGAGEFIVSVVLALLQAR